MRPVALLLAMLLSGCGVVSDTAPLIVLDAPAKIRVAHRETQALPGSRGRLLMNIDDIYGDQVDVVLLNNDKSVHTPMQTLKLGERIRITDKRYTYVFTLMRIKNNLTGTDYAYFEIAPAKALPTDANAAALDGE